MNLSGEELLLSNQEPLISLYLAMGPTWKGGRSCWEFHGAAVEIQYFNVVGSDVRVRNKTLLMDLFYRTFIIRQYIVDLPRIPGHHLLKFIVNGDYLCDGSLTVVSVRTIFTAS